MHVLFVTYWLITCVNIGLSVTEDYGLLGYDAGGEGGGVVDWGTVLQVGNQRVWFPLWSLEFFIDVVLPAAPWPWGRLSH